MHDVVGTASEILRRKLHLRNSSLSIGIGPIPLRLHCRHSPENVLRIYV
jgi:hypothetical protein